MVTLDTSLILTGGLISIRIAVMLAFTPVFTSFPMPTSVKVFLVGILSLTIAMTVPQSPLTLPQAVGGLFVAALTEFALGLLMAVGVFCAFAAFAIAGRTLDIQIGYAIGQVFDPVSRTQVPILTSIFMYVAVLLFFVLDVHHVLFRAAALTFELIPVGQFQMSRVNIAGLISLSGKLFSLGFMLVAPVIFCVLMVEVGLGILARGLPQMNVFVIALPIKIVTGLVALSFWARHMPAGMERIYASTFALWNGALH